MGKNGKPPKSRGGDDIFSEIVPMVTFELLEPGSSRGFIKSERPDWINEKRGIGLEVTSTANSGIGPMMGFCRNNRGRTFDELTKKDFGGMKGILYFRSREHFYGYDPTKKTVKVDGSFRSVYANEMSNNDFCDLLSSVLAGGFSSSKNITNPFKFGNGVTEKFSQKLFKLNSHYRSFDSNILYIHADPPRGGADGCMRPIAEKVSASQKGCSIRFDSLYVDCMNSLYRIDTEHKSVKKYDLERLGQKRRLISSAINDQYWIDGKPFVMCGV